MNIRLMATRRIAPPFPVVDWLARRSRTQQRVVLVLLALVGAYAMLMLVGRFSLDRAWVSSLTDAPVWSIRVRSQTVLVVLVGATSIAGLGAAARFAYTVRPAEGSFPNRLIYRYRDRMGPAHGWLLTALPIILGVRAAVGASGRWQAWLLFLHGPDLGERVPGVGMDLGYHLFRLPMLAVISGWLRQLVLIAFGIVMFGMLINGALKVHRGARRSSPLGLRVLVGLAALFAVLQAAHYVFVQVPRLATGRFGSFDGAGFTQVEVLRPSLWALAVVALITAVVVLRLARSERWLRLSLVLAGWGLLHLVLVAGAPTAVETVIVAPAEASRQLPYLAENLAATRRAYSLDRVETTQVAMSDGLAEVPSGSTDVDRVPLFGEAQMVTPLQVLQGTTATRITDVDLDRYDIDGTVHPVLIAARSASAPDLPERGWVQQHLVYTHGDGVVMIPADTTDRSGQPELDALAGMATVERPELYFGEGLDGWYAITGTQRREAGESVFDGSTGIPLDSTWSRMRLALASGDFEPLVSSELLPESQLLYRRAVRERLGQLAPFLSIDANPYPVVVGDRIVWVVDGYTTSSSYPYAQNLRSAGLPAASGISGRTVNYVHASVKATIDAYDGTVHLYRTDMGSDDPILDVWDGLFPGLFEPIDQMPQGLRAHLLYPQDFFTAQTAMLGRYHVTDPELLFNGTESWAISADAGSTVARNGGDGSGSPGPSPAVSLFMPGTGAFGGDWVATRPFGPGSAENPASVRDELSAIAIANHDDAEQMAVLEFITVPGRLVSSPLVAQSAIDTDGDLAAAFTLLNANGSVVEFGSMTPLILDDSLTWVRSIVVTDAASITTPRFYGVAAVSGGSVGQADTVSAALADAATR